ncbi:MAG: class I SAM-dependent methyltransferase [Solirubrobacterales bacterium]|nr:class I SAM-dependent methyltransferase [Solirubrobacterales bacterium]
MADRIDEAAPPGAILDVGAGEGTLIDALKEKGRKASGLERESDHPDIKNQAINEVEGQFAGVVFWHSLEHMGNPRECVLEASRLLIPGGVLIIAVPNNGSFQAAAFGDGWLHLDLPRHLVHLTSKSLTTGLEESGFRIGPVSGTKAGQVVIGWLDGLVGKLPGGLDLYQSLRRKSARRIEISPGKRAAAIATGVILFPVALACAVVEIAARRSGSVYVEAHRV